MESIRDGVDSITKAVQPASSPNSGIGESALATAATSKDGATKYNGVKPLPYWQLYRYMDTLDVILVIVGTIGAIAAGTALPLVSLVMGRYKTTTTRSHPNNDITPPLHRMMDILGPSSTSADFRSNINEIILYYVYLGIFSLVASYLQMSCWMLTATRQANRVRERYLVGVLAQEIGFFDLESTSGGLLQGLNEDTVAVQDAIGHKMGNFVQNVSLCVSGLIIAFIRGWALTLVMLALLPLLMGVGVLITIITGKLQARTTAAYGDANSISTQALANVRTVYAFTAEQQVLDSYQTKLDYPVKVGMLQSCMTGVALGMVQLVMLGGYALAMWYGSTQVASGAYTGGQVLQVLFAALMGGMALAQAAPNVPYFVAGCAAGGKIWKAIDRQPVIDHDAPGDTLSSVTGELELQDVVFSYPSRPDVTVFDGFNLRVEAGSTVALVGQSGSGKSTVIGLLERFYDPQRGAVLFDGNDVRSLQLRWYRQQLGLVQQEPTLFATSIYENIRYGNPSADANAVYDAARAANAFNFVSALPNGFDTQVGERGVQLSGGQKQRIAIARAILKNPKVLLLDEATSALDAESERLVQAALEGLMKGRTTVVVAHRLSTIMDADVVAVVSGGKIVEQGTPTKLLESPTGAFSSLVKAQQVAHSTEGGAPDPSLDDIKPRAASAGEDLRALLEQEAQTLALEARASMEESGHLSRKSGSASREGSTVSRGLRINSSEVAAVAKESFSLLRGAAPALDPVLVPAAALPTMAEQGDRELKKEVRAERRLMRRLSSKPSELSRKFSQKMSGQLKRLRSKKGAAEAEVDEDADPPIKVNTLELFKLNKPEWPYLSMGVLASAGAGVVMPIFAIAFSSILAVFYQPADQIESEAIKWSLVFVALGVGAGVCGFLQQVGFGYCGHKLAQRVRMLMLGSVLRQEIGWFDRDENNSAAITGRLAVDAMAVRGAVGDQLGMFTQNIVTLLGGYIIALINGWRMALVVIATLPLIAVAAGFAVKVEGDFSSKADELFSGANKLAMEAFTAIRTVAAFTMEKQIAQRYREQLAGPSKASARRAQISGISLGVSNFVIFGVYALGFWYGSVEIENGTMTFEQMNTVFFAIVLGAFGMAQAQQSFPDLAKGGAATQRVFKVIKRQPRIDGRDEGERLHTVKGEVQLRDVTFAYPQRREVTIFKDFNLTIAPSKVVALVGESGSGKSTVIGLVERFYDPLDGAVLFDGVDIRSLQLYWYRHHIGLVGQEPVLFNMSVRENLTYGRIAPATDAELEAAARAANAWDFIRKQPQGLDTQVGEGGLQLSGGQKQRVAIARAILRDPKVLLLDEATSALDAESERLVQAALEGLMKGRTTLVVAHRLSTVRNADSIAVVHKGSIVEQGTHEQLLESKGAYFNLVRLQAQAASVE